MNKDSNHTFIRPPSLSPLEKVHTLGLMVNRIVHEINNSIQGTLLLVDFLKLNYPEEETIDNLDQELQNLKGLTHRISAYMKMNDLEIGPINLSAAMTEAISFMKDITSDPIFTAIEFLCPPSILWVKGNFFYLQQAFLNILLLGSWSIKQHGSSSPMKIEISDDPSSKMSSIQIRYPWSSLMEGDNSLKNHTETVSLDFAEKVFRFHQGELQISRNDDGEAVITLTLPASTSSSD
ncbi:MAG: hypothetical protein ACMUIA_10465 [bacterium]